MSSQARVHNREHSIPSRTICPFEFITTIGGGREAEARTRICVKIHIIN